MKTSENLKELYPIINSMLGEIDSSVKDSIKKIKKDISLILADEKIKLLEAICDGEKLNFSDLKNKYLTEKEIKSIKSQKENHDDISDDLYDIIEINGSKYFYENKENGKIYNNNSEIIGEFKEGKANIFAGKAQ
jgi:hypothetical protein